MPPNAARDADRKFITLLEAAGVIGVSAATIRRRIADGTLVGYRFGPRALRVKPADVEALGVPTNAWS